MLDAIIFNDTKVIKARIYGKKTSGGKIEMLFNKPLNNNKFLVFLKGKVKAGTKVIFENNLALEVIELCKNIDVINIHGF